MSEETKVAAPTEKTLADFKGNRLEILKAKSAFIGKYGYEEFEKLVINSQRGATR